MKDPKFKLPDKQKPRYYHKEGKKDLWMILAHFSTRTTLFFAEKKGLTA